ncbi:MAG: hypothetical protein FJ279_01380 [Planctomycetes bacterium]|nr:hypothetical protein [Planctomycetota bacterium]
MNWWLFGTGVMIAVDTLVRIMLAPRLAQHPGTVGGAMVAGTSAPYGVVMAAAAAVYSLCSRSWCPITGTILAGVLYVPVLLASLISADLVLDVSGGQLGNTDTLFFAEAGIFVVLSVVWRRSARRGKEITTRQQDPPPLPRDPLAGHSEGEG